MVSVCKEEKVNCCSKPTTNPHSLPPMTTSVNIESVDDENDSESNGESESESEGVKYNLVTKPNHNNESKKKTQAKHGGHSSSNVVPTYVLRSLLSAATSVTVDAQHIYVGTQDGTITQFAISTCKAVSSFTSPSSSTKSSPRAHERSVLSLTLLPKISRLLSQGREGVCHLWDLTTSSLLDTLHTGDTSFCHAHALLCLTPTTPSMILLVSADSNDSSQVEEFTHSSSLFFISFN
jgi:hypothetical protein